MDVKTWAVLVLDAVVVGLLVWRTTRVRPPLGTPRCRSGCAGVPCICRDCRTRLWLARALQPPTSGSDSWRNGGI